MNLQGHKALVTGASRGLGKAIAWELASKGCSVSLLARNETLLQSNLSQLPANHGQTHQYIDYDLAGIAAQPVDERIQHALDGASVLVNCAGITNNVLLSRLMNKYIESTINLNLVAPMVLSKYAYTPFLKSASRLKKNPKGSLVVPVIINISSLLSYTDYVVPGTSVYAASKAGLLGFTTSLAAELKGRVRVNTVMPGLIKETDMGATATIDGKVPTVALESVVQEVCRLIDDESITGQCVQVDGKN